MSASADDIQKNIYNILGINVSISTPAPDDSVRNFILTAKRLILSKGLSINSQRFEIPSVVSKVSIGDDVISIVAPNIKGLSFKGGYLFNTLDYNYDVSKLSGRHIQINRDIPISDLPPLIVDWITYKSAVLSIRITPNIFDKVKADTLSAYAKEIYDTILEQFALEDDSGWLEPSDITEVSRTNLNNFRTNI